MNNIPGMNECGDCGKSNASVVYPPRQTRIYSRLFYTPVFYTPLYMLCTPLYICSIHPCVCSIHPCMLYMLYTPLYMLYTPLYMLYLPRACIRHTQPSIYYVTACTNCVSWNVNMLSVFLFVSPVWQRGQPTIVSQSLQFKCFLCDLLYVAHILGRVGLTLIGEYFEPPRSLLGISIRSDAI